MVVVCKFLYKVTGLVIGYVMINVKCRLLKGILFYNYKIIFFLNLSYINVFFFMIWKSNGN